MGIIIALGIKNAFSGSYFSFGPYKQTVEYIADTYPAIQKVLHISEITAGPMLEYNGESDLSHYWLKARISNVDLFAGLHQIDSLADVLKEGEIFCAVQFNDLDLNKENLDLAMSESDLITTNPVADNKVENGNRIVVYVLRYVGEGLKKY